MIAAGFRLPLEPLRRTAHYPGETGCIAEARAFTAVFLDQLGAEWAVPVDPRTRGELLLLVSELITNAGRHSRGPCVLELEGTDEAVRVTVYDSGVCLPLAVPAAHDPTRVGGHGLEIVHAVAREVRAERVPVGKRITAVVRLPATPL
ncbi:ATP-binding protein [Streptomyces sp. NPDC058045]|uniref:ATP-binding protein n=1 Tax=Streptomyces sp. NPDC058045 TaxID=3346311 RepID=UPI0036EDE156